MDTQQKIKIILVTGVLLAAFMGGMFIIRGGLKSFRPLADSENPKEVRINGEIVAVEIARTDAEQSLGLANRDSLQTDRGMLFVYKSETYPRFWMKGMRFPLDIIWINDGEVVDITANTPVLSGNELPRYSPKKPVNRVLEVNAGWTQQHGVKIGDKVEYR